MFSFCHNFCWLLGESFINCENLTDYCKNETNKVYLDGLRYIAKRGTTIKAVVCDGHMGLLQAISFCPVQMSITPLNMKYE